MNKSAADFASMFLSDTPFVDVRAPLEFAAGSVPGAVNLPLLNDEERHRIGLTYKREGQEAAVALGHELVRGETRERRIGAWLEELRLRPDAVLFCFRGGLRSQITQAWLRERGVGRPIVEGGYKALRRFLLEAIERLSMSLEFEVVSGATGSGKTAFLRASGRPFVDLEELAGHRGSAFGALASPQPSQIDFENRLAVRLLKLASRREPVLIEDESRMIGRRVIPEVLFEKMKRSPRLRLEVSLEARVRNIFDDYVLNSPLGRDATGNRDRDLDRDARHFDEYRRAVGAISKKLGGARTAEVLADIALAEAEFLEGRGLETNRVWIEKLLKWYYHYW